MLIGATVGTVKPAQIALRAVVAFVTARRYRTGANLNEKPLTPSELDAVDSDR